MKFSELIKARYSVRSYKNKRVEDEKLEKILLAAHAAPTAANRQPVRLIVVREQEGLAKLGTTAHNYGAPLAVIVCADHGLAWKRSFDGKESADIDASILTDHMMLQAAALGLGTVWVCSFDPEVIIREFGLPEGIEPVNILMLGYAEGKPAAPDRHDALRIPLAELVHYEAY